MISQVVFDLPLDGPFDYSIPEQLIPQVAIGSRVKVSFGNRIQIGFVIGLLEKSAIAKLKPILSLQDASVVFNDRDLLFARDFCAYYGCSLGEALATILRNRKDQKPSFSRIHTPQYSLYWSKPGSYAQKVQEIMDGYRRQYKGASVDYCNFLILVPDAFRAQMISQQLKAGDSLKIGTRSAVFECDGRHDCVMMIDDEDPSYRQEQTPMYDTAQVLLSRSRIYGFDIAFVGISPSVELMSMAHEKQVKLIEALESSVVSPRLVDLSNYKFVPGLISPPVRDALDAVLKAGKKSILILNRKGSYRLTRCVDCSEILKCRHCDTSLIYSRSEGKFLCRHCTYTLAGDTVCPTCHKPSWRSQGIGVEQVQTELKKLFPQAKIQAFERERKKSSFPNVVDPAQGGGLIGNPDIIISTSAVLRFQGILKAQLAAFIDFDAELNRLDNRSAFNAFSLALHISSMVLGEVFIQTRNSNHYVLQGLSRGKIQGFYNEELKLRKEFGFSPYKHWIKINWRGKSEKITQDAAMQAYQALNKSAPENVTVTPPLADSVGRKRDQFRFNVMVQTNQIPAAMAYIKAILSKSKRRSRVIMTLNIDP